MNRWSAGHARFLLRSHSCLRWPDKSGTDAFFWLLDLIGIAALSRFVRMLGDSNAAEDNILCSGHGDAVVSKVKFPVLHLPDRWFRPAGILRWA